MKKGGFDELVSVRSLWLFVGMWAFVFVIDFAAKGYGGAWGDVLWLVAFFVTWPAYPLAFIFLSGVVKLSGFVRALLLGGLIVLMVSLALQVIINNEWIYFLRKASLLGGVILFASIAFAITSTEGDCGKNKGEKIWVFICILFFPFFGLFFIHRRFFLLMKNP